MNKIHAFGLLLVTLPLLSSCGQVVGALVPPQTITNPAGLTGATLAPSSTLQPESVGATISYSTEASGSSFDDFQFPDNIPFGIRPHALAFNTGFASATLSGTCTAPATVKVTLKSVSVTVKDASGSATINQTPNLVFTLSRTSQGLTSSACSVSSSNTFTVSADTATSDAIIKVLTGGGKNDASLNAAISADQDSMAGCRLSFKLGETTATLSNFS